MQTYTLFEEYITLGQVLKELGLIATGGQAKIFLAEHEGEIFYNGAPENRRGKKLRAGDLLELPTYKMSIKFAQADAETIAQHEAQKAEENRVKALVKKLNAERQTPKASKKSAPKFPGIKPKHRSNP